MANIMLSDLIYSLKARLKSVILTPLSRSMDHAEQVTENRSQRDKVLK